MNNLLNGLKTLNFNRVYGYIVFIGNMIFILFLYYMCRFLLCSEKETGKQTDKQTDR